MTLAQVQISVAIVTALIATWAGLLVSVALLLPQQTGRAEYELETNPKRCLLRGTGLLLLFFGGLFLTGAPQPAVKLLGFLLMSGLLAVMTVGAAGVAALMGRRISEMTGARTSFGALVRGSIAYSLAIGFPWIGWMIFAPVSMLFAVGAGFRAVWPLRPRVLPTTAPIPTCEQS